MADDFMQKVRDEIKQLENAMPKQAEAIKDQEERQRTLASSLSKGRPNLEQTLRDLVDAWKLGELRRAAKNQSQKPKSI